MTARDVNPEPSPIPSADPPLDLQPTRLPAREPRLAPPLGALDAQAVRLLLTGGSVVDWRRLDLGDRATAGRLLSVNGFDVHEPRHVRRLVDLHTRALDYLDGTFDHPLPSSVRAATDAADLLLLAAQGGRHDRTGACVVLKVMHVLNHLDARRLVFHLDVSEEALFDAALERTRRAVAALEEGGIEIVGFEPSKKTDTSLVTKLLSKPRVTAAQIFDRLRCRLVTRRREDLVPTLAILSRRLFPFNHVIPGESHNTILSPEELHRALAAPETAANTASTLDAGAWIDEAPGVAHAPNPATARAFRMINFVVDLPVRLDTLGGSMGWRRYEDMGHLVYVPLEIQLFDEATQAANGRGEASHDAYKRRQVEAMAERLWGDERPPLKPIRASRR